MLLILKKTIFDLIILGEVLDITEMSHDFVRGQSVAVSDSGARPDAAMSCNPIIRISIANPDRLTKSIDSLTECRL